MAAKKQHRNLQVFQMKVTLEDISPLIWRRIQVKSDTTLSELHRIMTIIMGWDDYHLHEFVIHGISYSMPTEGMTDVEDEKNVTVAEVVSGEKMKFTYIYDFGDDWRHKILVEKILPIDPDIEYPVCIKGKRAAPPEDCGGVGGYYNLIEVIQDPDNPEHEEMLEWVGGSYDPEAFDLEMINSKLKLVE